MVRSYEEMNKLEKINLVVLAWRFDTKISAEQYVDAVDNLIKAAKHILDFGPEIIIIKKGEHGALLISRDTIFSAPAYPLESIYDPTGAGDTFAGGFIGYLHKTQDLNIDNIKRAVIYGSTMASFCVEQFSTKGLEEIDYLRVNDRYREFLNLSKCNEL